MVCCKHCADHVWRRWSRDGACDGVEQGRRHTLAVEDDWPSALDDAGRRAPLLWLSQPTPPE